MPEPGAADATASRRQLETKLAELFAEGPEGPAWVLDVACGSGPATRVLMESLEALRPGARRISLDLDPGELVAARTAAAGLATGGQGWLCANLFALPLSDRCADYVVALNIFHGVDHRGFGLEMHRVLGTGGRALIYDRVPQLLPFSRFALILGRDQLATLGRLPRRPSEVNRSAALPTG